MFGLLSLPQHPACDLRLEKEISGNVWGTVLASVSPSVKWDSQSTPIQLWDSELLEPLPQQISLGISGGMVGAVP